MMTTAADRAFDYSPWPFWRKADAEQQARQRDLQNQLVATHPTWTLGSNSYLATSASIDCDTFVLGDRSYVAAHAYLTGDIVTGRDCTINPFAVVRGPVTMGDGVRIGAHTSIIGFNHTFDDLEVEIFRQESTSVGISIGNDVWIGSHVMVLDGVTIGAGAVIAGGAVVTKDVAPGMVMAGNPARALRRRGESGRRTRISEAAAVAGAALDILPEVLRTHTDDGSAHDVPDAPASVRAHCDAIELGALLPAWPTEVPWIRLAERVQVAQDPVTGMVRALDGHPAAIDADEPPWLAYQTLCSSHALPLLGSRLEHPVEAALLSPAMLQELLVSLPWQRNPWRAGSIVDLIGTALAHASINHGCGATAWHQLIGWLTAAVDPETGMWGSAADPRLLVNGYYRAVRGTFGLAGLPVPYPERVIDTVLEHAATPAIAAADRFDACTVLDIIHPLWLAAEQTGHRRDEVVATAGRIIGTVHDRWQCRQGFTFDLGARADPAPDSLQGWEMWLSILWYSSDLLDGSGRLGYVPRGVHRPVSHRRPAKRFGGLLP